ncbi:MAG: fluoride efflux transporter CrcB [Acidobacteriota bacterium]
MWPQVLAVGLGGALGSCLRFAVAKLIPTPTDGVPWATVAVNLVGCLLIGAVVGWSAGRDVLDERGRALVVTGFLGGLTTFSAFGLETVRLIESGRTGGALAYLAAQLLGGLLAVVIGLWIGRHAL